MVNAETVLVGNQYPIPSPSIASYVDGVIIYVSDESITLNTSKKRIHKLSNRLETLNKRLSSKPFTEKAPKEIVDKALREKMELEMKIYYNYKGGLK